jgi:hypothetical protein
MHESPLELLGGNPLLEAVSRANPFAKGAAEYAFGQSAFQKSAEGGRPLTDMDPLLGRLASNLTGRSEPYRVNPLLEHVLANSPISRALTTAKTLTDRRPSATLLKKALNLGTGLRITDVSPASQDAVTRETLNNFMKHTGAAGFERVYFPQRVLAGMTDRQRATALQLQALQNALAKRAKERKKAAVRSSGQRSH